MINWYWSTHQIIHAVRRGRYVCNQATAINRQGRINSSNIPQAHICKNCIKHFDSKGRFIQ